MTTENIRRTPAAQDAAEFEYYERRVTDAARDLARFVAHYESVTHAYVVPRIEAYREAVADRDRAIERVLDRRVAEFASRAAVDADSTRANGGETRSFAVCPLCGFTNNRHAAGCANAARSFHSHDPRAEQD